MLYLGNEQNIVRKVLRKSVFFMQAHSGAKRSVRWYSDLGEILFW